MKTRQPSGKTPAPLILVQGPAKAGKTTAALQYSTTANGRTLVFDLGDGAADAYATIGNYEIVVTDGTWTGFIADLKEATADETVACIIVDSISIVWAQLSIHAEQLARRTKLNKQALAADPDAEINVGMTHWNAAKDRWGQMIHILRSWSGVAILVGLTEQVAVVDGQGRPTNQKTTSLQAEKRTASTMTLIIDIDDKHIARFVGGITPPDMIRTGDVLASEHNGGPVGALLALVGETEVSAVTALSGVEPELVTPEQWALLVNLPDDAKERVRECAAENGWRISKSTLTAEQADIVIACAELETEPAPQEPTE